MKHAEKTVAYMLTKQERVSRDERALYCEWSKLLKIQKDRRVI